MAKSKVFCIGFHKTGTTSLGAALRVLGYKVTGPKGIQDPDIARNAVEIACKHVNKYDAFQDNPWPIIYKDLDARYPGSKFILTLRNPESWIASQVKHFGRKNTEMRRWIYGGAACPEGNEAVYVKRFEDHNKEVLAYFKDRPGDLLVIDLAKGDGWEKLCPFLNRPVPSEPFPHANKASDREAGTKKPANPARAKKRAQQKKRQARKARKNGGKRKQPKAKKRASLIKRVVKWVKKRVS